ncbi:Uncharacterized protein APZ42_020262 [Daphnia magna]|uniref:Uncharacterized protein n=1 Tax=Daphnia magna TaxID=35525 RepID=A0A162CD66_9CRUS|nr:Uncharacterized protein APZ42_020262 [Daphnia magna]
MAHAELDATTIKSSHSTNSLSYSPAILKGGQQLQQQPSQISAESIGNCSVANAPPSNQQQRRKTVYFTVGQRQEVAIFEDYTPSEDIKSKWTNQTKCLPLISVIAVVNGDVIVFKRSSPCPLSCERKI